MAESKKAKVDAVEALHQKKEESLRFRATTRQLEFWIKALKDIGVKDFSSYARMAIDRAIFQDMRSKDPKWKEFIAAIQDQAKKHLGAEIDDTLNSRLENLSEIYDVLWKDKKRHA